MGLPIRRHCEGSRSVTLLTGSSVAASSANSVYLSSLPSGSCTAPRAVLSCATGTPVFFDAASLSVSRATAPASRSLSKLSGTVDEPPVTMTPMSLNKPPIAPRIASA